MSLFKPTTYRPAQRSLLKGALAGLAAGIAATAAKSLAERIYPPRTNGKKSPSQKLVGRIAGRALTPVQQLAAGEALHWSFGLLTGAAYGALAEYYPAATAKDGATFGLALASLTHEAALPAMGLATEADLQSTQEHVSEVASNLVYGIVTETIRSRVRRMLD